jgi:hypothetical protein
MNQNIKPHRLSEIEDGETVMCFALRKQTEHQEALNRIALLRDGIAKIAISENQNEIVDLCSQLLSEV